MNPPPNDVARGQAALRAYVRTAKLNKTEAQQDYTVTDAIVSLLKFARSKGFSGPDILRSAESHFTLETEGNGRHSKDSDCTVSALSGCCIVCEIDHSGGPCQHCGQVAYHKPECPLVATEDEEDKCIVCGEPYAPGGDGHDGCCPSCADKVNEIAESETGDNWDEALELYRERREKATPADEADKCPNAEDGKHKPDLKSMSVDHDGDAAYIDIACSACGRSGCVGKLDVDVITW